MWTASVEDIEPRVRKTIVLADGRRASFNTVIDAWQNDSEFRSFMIDELSAEPHQAYCWETPPVSLALLEQPFEYVTVARAELNRSSADPRPFESQFSAAGFSTGAVSFANLGGDATLVVPVPLTDHDVYAHLGIFVRMAPEAQKHALFRAIGLAMRRRISSQNTWLGTAGLGVSWLHVRLDSRPKYYNYLPYRTLGE